ncbi:hypothetical protein PUN28_005072 [Cardiocondyla obscurior]|uniref:Uncharacterized protein n=1 Tax=Cardiocondyla obscurior TaxID=286306 RepID=A0AAW2GFV4_9HYME
MPHVSNAPLTSLIREKRLGTTSSCGPREGPRCRASANISRDPEERANTGHRVPEVANSLAYTRIPLSAALFPFLPLIPCVPTYLGFYHSPSDR